MSRLGTVLLLLLFAYQFVGRAADVSSMTPREEASSNSGRTLFSIIWSCLSTTIICAWSAMHPNIQPREGIFKATIRRFELLVVTLVAPEVLPAFAFNQLFAAIEIRNEYNMLTKNKTPGVWEGVKNFWETVKKSFSLNEIEEDESGGGYLHPEWTLAHGFYVVMGGIRLVEPANDVAFEAQKDDVPEMEKGEARGTTVKPRGRVTILTEEMLRPVLAKGIEINVTSDEIANTAKGDALSKTIFVVQSSWFVVQCITRAAQGLTLTELELTTLALASLNGITLLLWWKKPLGAQTVVRVNLDHELKDEERATEKRDKGSNRSFILPHLQNILWFARATLLFWSHPNSVLCWSCVSDSHNPECNLTDYSKLPLAIRLPLAVAALLLFPIIALILYIGYTLGDVVLAGSNSFPVHATHVPTFYAPQHSFSDFWHPFLMMIIATLFGAIHCSGWNFIFPTHQERSLWRLSSIAVAGVPLLLFIILLIVKRALKRKPEDSNKKEHAEWILTGSLSLPFMLLYVAARVVILGLAIALLRHQPPSAFTAVDWSGFYPRIF